MNTTVTKTTLKMNGMEYLCRTAGLEQNGELIIFLHGFPESSIIWEETMSKLASLGYRCLAPDQRGYSDGARPNGIENYSLKKLSADAIGFADVMGCSGKFHLVGHDLGAAVGWNVVTLYPQRIQTWTALSVPHWAAYKWALENDPVQKQKGAYVNKFMEPNVPESLIAANDYAVLRHLWEGFDQKTQEDYMRIFSQPEARTAVINWYRGIMQVQEQIPYGDIETPTAFIWGNEDLALARAGVEKSHTYMKGYYDFHELNAGHWLTQFNEPEVSEIIIKHIQKFPIE
ncbi:haloalkane dehalogenase [Paenibacillus sp. J45TS6]|uniref:alpha/beta fold hydrolase n=1 Tax=Paenibacillus sp. J45TS6 TaxID=2807196 RepID=UPI001B201034|nr:alpha/beta hydrolase [Paenibacillus sp. J45TS6]GIP43474.1 haloalkane dehalogenase [Paenibacillus sp. J45TS6]